MTAYGYDALGRLLEVTNALGNKTRYAYDAVGNIVGKTDALGRVTSYRYDLRGLLTQQTNPLGEMTRLLYDGNGNTTGIQHPDGNTVVYEYDPMNRLTQILYHDGKKVQYAYDAIGRRTSMTDALGTTTYAYDALNRLTEVTDTANRTIRYEWTPTGQRSKVTYPDGGVVSYQYDLMDRMTQVTDPRGLTTSYDYDARGLMVSKQLPMQGGSTYSYDGLGQLLELKHTDRFGKVVEQLTYAYDPVGNRIRMERAKDYHDDDDYDHDDNDYGRHDDGYDHDEDNEKEHYDHDDKDRYNEDDDHPKRVVTEYAYDALNQLTQVQKYNASAPAVPAITSYSYDAVGNRLSKSSTWGMKTNREDYTYNPADQLIHWQSGKGYKDYTYDLRGNLLNVTGTIYDHDGDKGMVTKDVYGASVSNHEYENNVSWNVYGAYARDHDDDEYHRIDEQYSWDAANRLVQQINTKGKMTRFSYDGDGNRVSMALGKRHDDDDHRDDDHRGHEDKSYRYDDVEDEHWTSLRFTNDVSLALPEVIQVRSDVREDDPWQTSFVYGAGQERLSMTYFDNEDRDHMYGDDDKHPRTMYYLQDALGSVIGLMNSKGHVTARNSYDEFGIAKKRDHDDNGPKYGNLYGYTGLEYDDSTGLNYARARYYKPEIGRFISEDTYKGNLWEPQSQNGYAYVANNPINWIDPSGQCGILPDGNLYGCIEVDSTILWAKMNYRDAATQADRDAILRDTASYREENAGYWTVGYEDSLDDYKLTKDDLYYMWYFGDNQIALLVDPSTGEQYGKEFQTKLYKGYMAEQIQKGFPDFWAGIDVGTTIVSMGGASQLLKLALKSGAKAATAAIRVERDIIIRSATASKKGGETVVGHALQKHAGRNPDIWGKVKGGPEQINQTAQKHLEDILDGPGEFTKVTNDRGISFLEKKLEDGRGLRLNLDGTFKGFIDQ